MASAPLSFTNVRGGYTVLNEVVPSSTVPAAAVQNSSQTQSPLQKFLKGEPKALGVVQIMIGLLTILFGIVITVPGWAISVNSGVVFWGSLLVKAALVLNIHSAIAAGSAIIIFSLDLAIPHGCYLYDSNFACNYIAENVTKGISGVLLVLSLLQFAISVAVSAFTCKATCTDEPTVNTIIVVQNPESGFPVVSTIPDYQAQLGVSTVGAVAISAPPMGNPPAYYEKREAYN